MKYKAIIFDLDNTAIPNKPNGMPSQQLIDAIAKAQGSLRLCAATGRPITNAKAILSALKLKDPCVISAGTQVINPLTDEILWQVNIDAADVAKILAICKPYRYEIFKNEIMEGSTASDLDAIEGNVNVLYIMGCARADAEAIFKELDKIPSITAAGVTSWTHEAIDIHVTHRSATKEHAVGELLRILGLNKDEVIGVGDADNDVHLFAGVGYKVAMGNGTNKLKSLADEVIGSVDNDGLAKLIAKYGE
jgi:HAD superfamily hydrolase (TIGR01484 family)